MNYSKPVCCQRVPSLLSTTQGWDLQVTDQLRQLALDPADCCWTGPCCHQEEQGWPAALGGHLHLALGFLFCPHM